MLAASVLGAAWTTWTLTRALRRLRAARRDHPLAEAPARLVLATATRTGSLTITTLAWWLLTRGSTTTSPLISSYHILDAIGQALLILAIALALALAIAIALALALTAIILDPPLALVALAGGGSMLHPRSHVSDNPGNPRRRRHPRRHRHRPHEHRWRRRDGRRRRSWSRRRQRGPLPGGQLRRNRVLR